MGMIFSDREHYILERPACKPQMLIRTPCGQRTAGAGCPQRSPQHDPLQSGNTGSWRPSDPGLQTEGMGDPWKGQVP